MESISRRLSSSATEDKNLRRQISDLDSLMKGVIKLVLTKQQDLRSALEKMVKAETALLHRRDFEGKLQEWSLLVEDVEDFVKHLGPFNEHERDLELLYFEVEFFHYSTTLNIGQITRKTSTICRDIRIVSYICTVRKGFSTWRAHFVTVSL